MRRPRSTERVTDESGDMARFRLTTHVDAPVEDVFRYVTGYGPDGSLDEAIVQEKYGEILEREDGAILVREDVRRYPEDDPELITWRCSFEYASSRTMEALDSAWADRHDSFEAEGAGTRWTVRWNTRIGGLRGLVQYVVFRLRAHRWTRRDLLDPVKDHFEGVDSPPL